jgi:uncharacterized protein (TIGR00255 family)
VIRSMTGFGRAALDAAGASFTVELRSVNHRHLDMSVRLPRPLAGLEVELRRALARRFVRGKIDVVVATPTAGARPDLELDRALADRYVAFARALSEQHGLPAELRAADVLGLPGVARVLEHALDEAELRPVLLAAVERAAEQADAMRVAEGAALDRELRGRLGAVAALAREVSARAGEVAAAARERLRKRAEQLSKETGLADEARLAQEVVAAADRMDVTEEVVRLGSHVAQFEAALAAAAPDAGVGRRLEFLLQEMSREVNTIGAKSGDAPLAHRVVDLKTELERIREQVMNVE